MPSFKSQVLIPCKALPTLDYETNASTFNIRVRVTDQHGFFLDRILTLALNNAVEDLDGDGVEGIIMTTTMTEMAFPIPLFIAMGQIREMLLQWQMRLPRALI